MTSTRKLTTDNRITVVKQIYIRYAIKKFILDIYKHFKRLFKNIERYHQFYIGGYFKAFVCSLVQWSVSSTIVYLFVCKELCL